MTSCLFFNGRYYSHVTSVWDRDEEFDSRSSACVDLFRWRPLELDLGLNPTRHHYRRGLGPGSHHVWKPIALHSYANDPSRLVWDRFHLITAECFFFLFYLEWSEAADRRFHTKNDRLFSLGQTGRQWCSWPSAQGAHRPAGSLPTFQWTDPNVWHPCHYIIIWPFCLLFL